MKGLFRLVAVVVLLSALAGAVILVRKNQETRRGATAAETSSSILPDVISVNPGSTFSVNVWLNTGKDTDKMAGAEFRVSYDAAKVKYISLEPQSGFTLVNDPATVNVVNTSGSYLDIKMITMGTEKGGAIDVAKLRFQAVSTGTGSLLVQQGVVMITGQPTTWSVAKNNPGTYTIGGSVTAAPTITPKPTTVGPTVTPRVTGVIQKCYWCGDKCINSMIKIACVDIAPPAGKLCVTNSDGSCAIKDGCSVDADCPTGQKCYQPPMPTCPAGAAGCVLKMPDKICQPIPTVTTPPVGCGQRCYTDTGCAKGLICAPIWWPCTTLATDLKTKLQNNVPLTSAEAETMVRYCPEAAKSLPTAIGAADVVMPSFYGVCRNVSCPNRTDCNCGPVPSVIITPPSPTLVIVPTPKAGEARLGLQFYSMNPPKVGDEVTLQLSADVGGNNKISGVSTKFNYGASSFDVTSVELEGRGVVVRNEVDKVAGTITIYYTWSLPADRLFNRYTVATVKMKAKTAGTKVATFDTVYGHEVSGLDESGKSVKFTVVKSSSNSLVVSEAGKCLVCAIGLPKNKGNANCDEKIDLLDFEYWRSEAFDKGGMTGKISTTWMADFNCDSKADLLDFEIWRFTVFP